MADLQPYSFLFGPELVVRSQVASRKGIDNSLPAALEPNARLMSQFLANLDFEARKEFGQPLTISSWYRCPKLNAAVGGSSHSDHMLGLAADVEVYGVAPRDVCLWTRTLLVRNVTDWHQIILEFGNWMHIAIMPEGKSGSRDLLTATMVNGKAVYTAGIK